MRRSVGESSMPMHTRDDSFDEVGIRLLLLDVDVAIGRVESVVTPTPGDCSDLVEDVASIGRHRNIRPRGLRPMTLGLPPRGCNNESTLSPHDSAGSTK